MDGSIVFTRSSRWCQVLGSEFHTHDVRRLVQRFAPDQADLKSTNVIRLSDATVAPWLPSVRLDEESMAAFTEQALSRRRLEPPLVRRVEGGRYQVIAGARWLEAARRIGDQTMPAVVIDVNDATAIAISLTYALSRERLTPWEEAQALAELQERLAELGQDSSEAVLAVLMEHSETWIRARLEIARRLTADVIEAAEVAIHDLYVLDEAALTHAAGGSTPAERASRLRAAITE